MKRSTSTRFGRSVAILTVLTSAWLFANTPAQAQRSGSSDFQSWTALLGTGAPDAGPAGPALWLDLHARRGRSGTLLIVRPALGYRFAPWGSLWAGYAWVPSFADESPGGDPVDEHRIWQQVIFAHRYSSLGLSVQSRTRFEQRFHEQGEDVALRLRQFVRVNWQPDPALPLGLALWDELFLGLTKNDWGAPQGMDQNRLFVGPFLTTAPWSRLEMGYLFVYLDRETDLYAHVLAVNLFVSLRPRPPSGTKR